MHTPLYTVVRILLTIRNLSVLRLDLLVSLDTVTWVFTGPLQLWDPKSVTLWRTSDTLTANDTDTLVTRHDTINVCNTPGHF